MRLVTRLLLTALLVAGLAACSDDRGDDVSAGDDTSPTTAADADATTTTGSAEDEEPAPPTTAVPFVSERYADPTYWVCLPDRADDPCTTNMDYTSLAEDGTTEVVAHEVAVDPPIDCFFIYPTVNLDPGGVAEFDGNYQVEIDITRAQAGRFSSVCRVFAPLYRQNTFGGGEDVDREAIREQAYGDVEEAFQHYLANDNDGRPFVVMGHSQGSSIGIRLLQEHIDGDEALRSQMVSALLIGMVVTAPEGEDVGGTFDNIPACRADGQTGCVVTYASFDVESPPGPDAGFGAPREEGDTGVALCTNPAALEGGSAELQMIDNTGIDPVATFGAAIETPYVALPGLVSGECVTQDGRTYLAVTVHPGDGPRTDSLNTEDAIGWGLHPLDYSLAMGDLVDLVAAQGAAAGGAVDEGAADEGAATGD